MLLSFWVCLRCGAGASVVVVASDVAVEDLVGVGVSGQGHAGDEIGATIDVVGGVKDGGRGVARYRDGKGFATLGSGTVGLEHVELVASLVGGHHVGAVGDLVQSARSAGVLVDKLNVTVANVKLEDSTAPSALCVDVLIDARVGNGVKTSAGAGDDKRRVVKLLGESGRGKVDLEEEWFSGGGGVAAVAQGTVFVPEELSVEGQSGVGLDLGFGLGNVGEINDVEMAVSVGVGPELVAVVDRVGVHDAGADLHDGFDLIRRGRNHVGVSLLTGGRVPVDAGVDEDVAGQITTILVLHVHSIGPAGWKRLSRVVRGDGSVDRARVRINDSDTTGVEGPEAAVEMAIELISIEDGTCWDNKRGKAREGMSKRETHVLVRVPLLLCFMAHQSGSVFS